MRVFLQDKGVVSLEESTTSKESKINMSTMSTMHSMVRSLADRYGFDAEEACRYLELEKPKAKKVAMVDGKKVKRACSAYLFYTTATRPGLQKAHPDKKMPELSKMMGASWKTLSAEDKKPYEEQALADKERYMEEMSRAEMVAEAPKKRGKKKEAVEAAPTLKLPEEAADAPKPEEDAPKPKKKPVAKAGAMVKTVLPYCGQVLEGACEAIRKNHGLFTQCTMPRLGGETLCKTCCNQLQTKGALAYGTVSGRAEMLGEKGIVVTKYAGVMRKLNISRAQAEEAAGALGWTIAEEEFVEDKPKGRGRPKKARQDPSVSSTDESGSDAEAAEKPKPKKKKAKKKTGKVVSSAQDGEDLITTLLKQAEEREEREAEDEEPLQVEKFEFDGVEYLRSADGAVFDVETQEPVGRWDDDMEDLTLFDEQKEG